MAYKDSLKPDHPARKVAKIKLKLSKFAVGKKQIENRNPASRKSVCA